MGDFLSRCTTSMAMMSDTDITIVLRKRGLAAPAAALVAETGLAIFKNAFERWTDDTRARDFAVHVHAAVRELQAATAAMARGSSSRPAPSRRGGQPTYGVKKRG
jgi:hypothetical protein